MGPLVVLIAATLAQAPEADCSCRDVKLWGRVKVVKLESHADLRVQVVKRFENLRVKKVKRLPNRCGRWQFVRSLPDFKILLVKTRPDLRIRFVQHRPGFPD
jgi:hypothetical protein